MAEAADRKTVPSDSLPNSASAIRSRLASSLEDDARFESGLPPVFHAGDAYWQQPLLTHPDVPEETAAAPAHDRGVLPAGASAEAFRRILEELDIEIPEMPAMGAPADAPAHGADEPGGPDTSRRNSVSERLAEAERLLQELERQTQTLRDQPLGE